MLRQMAMYSDGEFGSQTPMAALLFGAELMMLLGAVGFTWEPPGGKAGETAAISAIAAALAAANGIWAEVIRSGVLVEYFQAGGQGNPSLFKNLITAILLPLGLVLVNLAMEGRQAPPKAWKVDGDKYRRGFTGFGQFLQRCGRQAAAAGQDLRRAVPDRGSAGRGGDGY